MASRSHGTHLRTTTEGMTQDDVYCCMVDGFNPDDYQVLGAKEVEDAVMHTQASARAMFSDTEVLWDCAAGRSRTQSCTRRPARGPCSATRKCSGTAPLGGHW